MDSSSCYSLQRTFFHFVISLFYICLIPYAVFVSAVVTNDSVNTTEFTTTPYSTTVLGPGSSALGNTLFSWRCIDVGRKKEAEIIRTCVRVLCCVCGFVRVCVCVCSVRERKERERERERETKG